MCDEDPPRVYRLDGDVGFLKRRVGGASALQIRTRQPVSIPLSC